VNPDIQGLIVALAVCLVPGAGIAWAVCGGRGWTVAQGIVVSFSSSIAVITLSATVARALGLGFAGVTWIVGAATVGILSYPIVRMPVI
jgi:hypothetical protein